MTVRRNRVNIFREWGNHFITERERRQAGGLSGSVLKGAEMAQGKVVICGVNTSKLPTLSAQEKKELFEKIKMGDTHVRETFIRGNLRLVLSVIQRFSGRRNDKK